MNFSTNTQIDMQTFTHKLISTHSAYQNYGTGFIVDYNGSTWIFTCWHNIGPTIDGSLDVTGEVTALDIAFTSTPDTKFDLTNRRVVGARINGLHIDVAAIELHPDEKPSPPYFNCNNKMPFQGLALEKTFQIGSGQPGEHINVPIIAHYVWQGFPGQDISSPPQTFRAAGFYGSSGFHHWLLTYTPGGRPGTSGGLVLGLAENVAWLAGIHIHFYEGMQLLSGHKDDGSVGQAQAHIEWGAAVPIEIIFEAIDQAGKTGVSVVDLIK